VLWEKQINRLMQEEQTEATGSVFCRGYPRFVLGCNDIGHGRAAGGAGCQNRRTNGNGLFVHARSRCYRCNTCRSFQAQALEHTDTILLETAPGHETRCIESPFAGDFNAEKEKGWRSAGLDKKEIWAELEKLNVGRLRIASKGIGKTSRYTLISEIGED
jgi:hypothetical protein